MASCAGILQLLIAFSGLSAKVLTVACDDLPSQVVTVDDSSSSQNTQQQISEMPSAVEESDEDDGSLQDILQQMAAMLPEDGIMSAVNKSTVEDLNGDGVPEIYLSAGSGWDYYVFYYLDGEMRSVEDLTPWAWSSNLQYAENDSLVMSAFPHTTGTAGIRQYRIYEWTAAGYQMTEDLWRIPTEWEGEGEPVGFVYLSSNVPIDPFPFEEGDYPELTISQEEYEQKIEKLGRLSEIFTDGYFWGPDWWSQHTDSEDNMDAVYRRIQEQILSWEE